MKFLDISKQDLYIKKKIFKNIEGVIKKSDFILGEEVNKFEKNFAKFCDARFAVGCANGHCCSILHDFGPGQLGFAARCALCVAMEPGEPVSALCALGWRVASRPAHAADAGPDPRPALCSALAGANS